VAEEAGTDVAGVVLNRVKDHESELDIGEVESMLGHQVIMDVPEHGKVGEALAVKNLLYTMNLITMFLRGSDLWLQNLPALSMKPIYKRKALSRS